MRILKFSTKVLIFLFISFTVLITGLYIYAYLSPKLDLKTNGSMYIYDNSNNLIYQGSSTNEWVNIDKISDYLKNATISIEDKNFYKHHGFDYLRIAKAMYLNIKNKNIVQGASTISQQYIKNLYLDFNKTWKRKIEEAFLTLELEVHFDKDEILEGYLNTINYGQGCIGILNASSYYFNKSAENLTLEEALMLAGIPKNPSKYNPVSNYDNCINRAKLVAKAMVDNNMLSKDEYDNLFKDKIEIYAQDKDLNLQMLMYYQEAVLNELKNLDEIPPSLKETGGIKIYTTLDINAQRTLEENILNNKSDDEVEVAGVMTNPKTGAVVALTGGMDYAKSQYNRALYSKRQVGSTMKSFLYYAALENNFTMSTTFSSEPTTFNLKNGKTYSPINASDVYGNKEITMAAAVAYSDNIYAIKTHLFLGEDKMINVANKAGIKEKLNKVASLPLGTSEINILDYANGYNTFASGGYKNELYFIEKIEDLDGNILYEHTHESNIVLNPNYTYILNEMLTCTSSSAFIDYTTPTAFPIAKKLTKKYSIKTGTTNTDYWIVGYNPDCLLMLWSGYDNNLTMTSKIRKNTRNAWADIIESYLKDKEENWYETPENIVSIPLDSITGKTTNNSSKISLFYYLKGSEPGYNQDQIVFKNEE